MIIGMSMISECHTLGIPGIIVEQQSHQRKRYSGLVTKN